MKYLLLLLVLSTILWAKNIHCDADTDCFYLPQKIINTNKKVPALLYLSCTGAVKSDLDSIKFIGDSLGWVLFSCHKSRNHRDVLLNDKDIVRTYQKAIRNYPIDTTKVFIYGFSGQGVQALLEMFLHPTMFRGVITECAHAQVLLFAPWDRLKNNLIFLISREKDWNLNANILMHQKFQEHGIKDTIAVTPGEHSIGTAQDLFKAVKWLRQNY
ncbi:MAG: hypothetical protein N2201_03935 [candidate division WOR-3 bacterium]|nr:hypothetical protein [candidate division WOR-3 bacterium]